MTAKVYRIGGMDCAECAATVEKGVSKLDGVQAARVELATAKLYLEGSVSLDTIRQRVEALGYTLDSSEGQTAHPAQTPGGVQGFWQFLRSRTETRMAIIGGAMIIAMVLASLIGLPEPLRDVLLVLAMGIAGYPIARSGLNALWINREMTINLLMTIAAVGAVVIGEPLEAATVIFLFAIGEALEGYTTERARSSLHSLIDLAPPTAIKLNGSGEQIVPVEALQVGDVILIKPGERVAMDGLVLSGESDVNQAPITGESVPAYKAPGAEVFAGTINGSGSLRVQVQRLAADNTLSRIIHLVEEAQSVRAPSQRLIDQFARVYTPAVVIAAALIAVLPPVLFNQPFWDVPGGAHGWLYRALSLLVIACPCALVISAPVTVISGITAAARHGVLIKGGVHLEALARIKAIAFDKTGTLTTGQPVVTANRSAACETGIPCGLCDEVLALASAVEMHSTHPLAKAVVRAATERGLHTRYSPAEAVEVIAGRGVRGVIAGQPVIVGSHSLFDTDYPHSADFHEMVNAVEAQGQTAMLLALSGQVQGYITVADAVREDSQQVIGALKALDVTPIMLTGDNAAVASSIAESVGIHDFKAGMLPTDKVDAVRALMDQYGQVAMVGDGINDTPALAAATVGIAMGGAGSAQALETADMALMADDLSQLPFAVRLARFTRQLIVSNVAFSFATKAVFLALGFAGITSLWLAILADVGVSLAVTLNGMRPLRFR